MHHRALWSNKIMEKSYISIDFAKSDIEELIKILETQDEYLVGEMLETLRESLRDYYKS
jgi:hypothetical protein